jgi:type IV pilus assembly protein PilQ
MRTPRLPGRRTLLGLTLLTALGLAGCAAKVAKPDQEFFKEWQARSESARGFSPSAPWRPTDLPELQRPEPPPGTTPVAAARPLPQQRISLRMVEASVPSVLRALAKAVDQNVMINERVRGVIDISLKEVPWDQAFLGILRTHGLAYVWEGDIIRVITLEDKNRELEQLETEQKIRAKGRELELFEPLLTRIVEIEYTNAVALRDNLAAFLSLSDAGTAVGSVLVDAHTNSLIIQATRQDLARILPLIEVLDRPTPQVLIEAYIVEANKEAARALGVQWGGLYRNKAGDSNYFFTPGSIAGGAGSGVTPGSGESVNPASGIVGNFPAPLSNRDVAGNLLGFNLGLILESASGNILIAQLQALEEEGVINILSSPSITTLDNQEAFIESGREVPYQTVEDDEVKIEYKQAVLRLEVTPHVIDGGTIKLDILTTKDELDFENAVGNNPIIITKKARTGVILFNGQTTVIGGLSKETKSASDFGIPYLRDIPYLGYLFGGYGRSKNLEDLLIFITPHILAEQTAAISRGYPEKPIAPGPAAE